ncbi:SDR family NAD(P)-dependent oxidoreductase [Roseibium sp. HPY-6]|uniref:SDR family NAD(P)-dependent oxidoreductase n=1 Tax=Roseibium sp. HPY-6 TaxID=3229852 RepID=UPI00338F3EE4
MKNCLIVGAGEGVSRAVAKRFGTAGYRVGLISRNATNLQRLAADLASDGVKAFVATADAGQATELVGAMEALIGQMGACDVLIYNAAVLKPGNALDVSTEQIAAELEVNLLGAHRAVSIVAPGMIERRQGSILFTGGGLSLEPFPEWTSLALGKAALRSLAISLFKELSPKGVHVAVLAICGIVEPGGPFDPEEIANEYWRVATNPTGLADREIVFQPVGTDPFYNDPDRVHAAVSLPPKV